MVVLFFEPISVIHNSNVYSLSSMICLIIVLFSILFPLYAGILTYNFWNKTSTIYAQPIVTYSDQFILYVTESTGTTFYSSMEILNTLTPNKIQTPIIKSSKIDSNSDGYLDKVQLSLFFNTNPLNVQNIKLILFFQYGLAV